MTTDGLLVVAREGLFLALLLSAPAVLAALLIGLLTSVLQAVTQVQEQTLSFVPKLIAVAVSLTLTGPWIFAQLSRFAQVLWGQLGHVGG